MATIRPLRTGEELDHLIHRSRERPVWLFKHSLTCGVSRRALEAFQEYAVSEPEEAVELALLEIQPSRELSREVERRTGVRHESPQAILLRDGQPVWDGSHWQISRGALTRARDQVEPGVAADP